MANTAANVRVGAGGIVYHAPVGTTLPTDTTTAPNVAFVDLGYISEDGLTIDPEEANSDIRAWGGDLVRRVTSEFGLTITFNALETNANVIAAYWGNGSATAWEMKQVTIRKSWILHATDGVKVHRLVLPDAEVTDRAAITYATTDAVTWGITLSTYPNAAGVHGFGYAS